MKNEMTTQEFLALSKWKKLGFFLLSLAGTAISHILHSTFGGPWFYATFFPVCAAVTLAFTIDAFLPKRKKPDAET